MPSLEKLTVSWNRSASWRRILLIVLVIFPTVIASRTMSQILPHKGGTPLEIVLVAIFAILFAWISIGFWTALLGFFVLLRGKNSLSVTESVRDLPLDLRVSVTGSQIGRTRTCFFLPTDSFTTPPTR